MKTLNEIACAAYSAHAKELHRLLGVNSLPWVELERIDQLCWEKSTGQVLAEVAAMGGVPGLAVPGHDPMSIKPTEVL